MAKQGIFVTGDRQINRKLARMEAKAVKKLLPKAAKQAAKVAQEDYKKRVPVKTGIMKKITSIRVSRYKHKRATGKVITRGGKRINVRRVVAEDVGSKVIYDRNKFYKKVFASGRDLSWDRKRNERWFYPAIVELGSHSEAGRRPLTKALFQNQQLIRSKFVSAMRQLVAGV